MQPMNDAALRSLVNRVGRMLVQRELRLATAESCTGGWIAKCVTDVPGSSEWFDRGFVSYSNEAKQEMLGLDPELIRDQGAVSRSVVEAMARGARSHSSADVALAVSGVAGPGGGSPDKPVGTVWLALATDDGGVVSEQRRYGGNREAIRRAAVARALGMIDETYSGERG